MFDPLFEWFIQHGLNSKMGWLLLKATWETIILSVGSCIFGIVIGLPVGIILFSCRPGQFMEKVNLYRTLSAIVNILRSIPFIIMIFWVSPLTSMLVKSTIGIGAVLVPLSIAAAPFIARMVENALLEIPSGLIEAAKAMGASYRQIIYKVLLPEALPSLINNITIALITLVGYSAMGGALGSGGLGQVGYQHGHISYNPVIMNTVLILLVMLVYLIQFLGDHLSKRLSHK